MSRGGKQPTTTKWLDRWKADVKGGCFLSCRLVGRNFTEEGVEKREDLFAAVPRLESKKLMLAAAREQRRRRELEEMKLMFIDVNRAHLHARCEEEEEWVQ